MCRKLARWRFRLRVRKWRQRAPKPARNVVELRPVSTISVAAPHQESRQPLTAIPRPELIPMEYHAERLRGTPVCFPEWQTARFAPAPPRFVVRPVFDRLDEALTPQKQARKEPAFAEVFNIAEARNRPSRTLGYRYKAIAAGLV